MTVMTSLPVYNVISTVLEAGGNLISLFLLLHTFSIKQTVFYYLYTWRTFIYYFFHTYHTVIWVVVAIV